MRVSLVMLETKVIVAPNSPRLRAKDGTIPATIAGAISGRVIGRKTKRAQRTSVPAASSILGWTASSDRRIVRTIGGNAITAKASTARVQRKAKTRPKLSAKNRPNARPTKQQQQEIAATM